MKKLFALLLVLLLPLVSFAESDYDLDSLPLVFSNDYADIYFQKIVIDEMEMRVYCVCQNKTDQDLSFRMKRFLVNGWDIVQNTTFDGFFRVSANSRKLDSFDFNNAVISSGISDPDMIRYIDFSLELSPWSGSKTLFLQKDYSHYDLPTE